MTLGKTKCMDRNMTNIEAFKEEFCQRVEELPEVNRVEFIGSVAGNNYVPGSSDIDVFVHGHKIPRQSKKQIIALVWELNTKYELGLEQAPCQHPTPFFIDGGLARLLYRLLKGRMEARLLRAMVKKVAPSYGFVWRLRQRNWE